MNIIVEMNSKLTKVDLPVENICDNEVLVLSCDKSTIYRLNETSNFLWKNSNNKSISDLADLIYSQLIDKESLVFDKIKNEVKESVMEMIRNGLINIQE